jgi:hypothetical protein
VPRFWGIWAPRYPFGSLVRRMGVLGHYWPLSAEQSTEPGRAPGETRPVPIHPELVSLLRFGGGAPLALAGGRQEGHWMETS